MDQVRIKIRDLIKKNMVDLFPDTPDEITDQILRIIQDDGSIFIPPTLDQATNYLIIETDLVDKMTPASIKSMCENFIDYYEAIGWKVGKAKTPMKKWKKALSNWAKRGWDKKSESKVQETIKAYMQLQNLKT